jgi:hypothetical protein
LKRSYQTEDIIKAKSTPEIIDLLLHDLPSKYPPLCVNPSVG